MLDILVTSFVPGTRNVGMRELVDDRDLGMTRQDRVEVHLLEGCPAVCDFLEGYNFEVGDKRLGLGPPVGFDKSEHHVSALVAEFPRLLEHTIGLTYASRGADINLKTALVRLGFGFEIEERFGFRPLLILHQCCSSRNTRHFFAGARLSRARLSRRTFTPGSPSKPPHRPRVF